MNRISQKIPFSRFRKSEFRNLVTEIIAVLGKYDSAEMGIKTIYDRLVVAGTQLSKLRVRYGSHPQTEELSVTREKCRNLIVTIVGQVKTLQVARLDTQANALAKVAPFVNTYLKPIVKSDWMTKSDILTEMFVAMGEDADLQAAISELNLTVFFNELKTLLESQQTIKDKRSESYSTREKSNTPELKTAAITALQEMFAAIELAVIEHPEKDYTTLINGINEKLNYYSVQIKTRITNNKKASDSTETKAA